MRRTLEAFFRHPWQLLALLIVLPVAGVAVTYFMVPRIYQASASLWALQRYYVVGPDGPDIDLSSSPAQTQVATLNELLQTRDFDLSVAKGIDLAPTLGLSSSVTSDPQQLQNALFGEISKHVLVTGAAYNLYTISYTNRDTQIAQQVVASVIANFGSQSLKLSVVEGQNLLTRYQSQLVSAQQDLDKAALAEQQYIHAHPGLSTNQLAGDPQYVLLDAQRSQAQTNVQNIQTTINTIKQSISLTGTDAKTFFQVIDPPRTLAALSRTKSFLVGGGIGLGVALLAWIIYLVIVVRRDRGAYSSKDLQSLAPFPVIMQLPVLTPEAVSLLSASVGSPLPLEAENRASTGKRAG